MVFTVKAFLWRTVYYPKVKLGQRKHPRSLRVSVNLTMDSSLLFQLFYTKSTIIISVFVTDIRNIENKTELYKFGKQMCQRAIQEQEY